MWAAAKLGTVSEGDLTADVIPIAVQPSPPTEAPGKLWWNTREQLMFVYTDVFEDTGVSLWLAFGPDRIETPCLAAEPLPPGAVVESWFDRWVTVADQTNGVLGDGVPRPIGLNQSGTHFPMNEDTNSAGENYVETQASGAWCRIAIDGIAQAYIGSGSGVSTSFFGTVVENAWISMDDVTAGGVLTNGAGNISETGKVQPVIGYATYSNTNNQESQPNFVHYFEMVWTGPRKTTGMWLPGL
jgi:hypothetical protein